MRDGWHEVKGRKGERRFERTDNPDVYVRVGFQDGLPKADQERAIERAMTAAEGPRPTTRAEAPSGDLKGE